MNILETLRRELVAGPWSTWLGTPLGAIVVPEVAANLCFGGHHHNRLFICASTSVYAIDVGTRGVEM